VRATAAAAGTRAARASAASASRGVLCKSGHGKKKNRCNAKAGEPHKAPRTNRTRAGDAMVSFGQFVQEKNTLGPCQRA